MQELRRAGLSACGRARAAPRAPSAAACSARRGQLRPAAAQLHVPPPRDVHAVGCHGAVENHPG
eukprot:1493421-Pyramimonas_sp.AAC.1